MPRLQGHALARILVFASLGGCAAVVPQPGAHAALPAVRPAAIEADPATPGGRPVIEPVPRITVGANATAEDAANGTRHSTGDDLGGGAAQDQHVDVRRGPSLAARPVEEHAVGAEPPPVTIPAGPTLINRITADAQARLASAGLATAGHGNPDVKALLPATGGARLLDLSRPATASVGQAAAKVKELAGLDLMALYRSRPDGIPLVTYRLCAESAKLRVSCSAPRPLMQPAAADVTGDGTPDILADLVPAQDVKDVLRAVDALASDQRRSDSLLHSVTGSAESGVRRARLDRQRHDLATKLATGLGLLTQRLPGSETRGRDLKAQVWAEYDIPASATSSQATRISVGVDGYRRGASLSALDWGVYTVAQAAAARGVVDVRAAGRRHEPGASVAMVVGVAGLTGRKPVNPALASLRQAPVPERFSAHARFDTRALDGKLTITTSRPAAMDALVLAGRPHQVHVTRIVADRVGREATAELTRTAKQGTDLGFTSPAPIGKAELYTYVYSGGRLDRAAGGSITNLPGHLRARYEPGRSSRLTVDAGAPRATSANVLYFDRVAAKTVLQAALADIPTHLTLFQDMAKNRLAYTASSKLGKLEAILQRGEGAISSPPGGHVTMIKDGAGLGVSGRLSGLAGFDVRYGSRPHAVLMLDSPGQPFLGAASVDRTHLARMEISDTPAEVEVDVDPKAKKAAYRASGTIGRLRAAYANTRTGPTIDATVYGVRSTVEASWTMGAQPVADVTATSGLKKVTLYVNKHYVTKVGPGGHDDISATVEDVHTHIRMAADTVAKRFDWTADQPVTSLLAFARTNGFRIAAKVTGVPARFDASWAGGTYQFRGISGPIGSATIALTNHDGALAPAGPHLAAHYRESTGRIDASVRVDGLSSVRFGNGAAGLRADFQAARQAIALDADAFLAGDLRVGALGTLGPVPGHLEISATGDGVVTYDTDGAQTDLQAKVWLGKTAAISGIRGIPALSNGLALADGGCAAGSAGCARDRGPFCTAGRGCFGIRGLVRLTGLPAKLTADMTKKTVAFSGYRPGRRDLEVFLASKVLAPVPVKALATLRGLPETLTSMSVGPFDVAGAAGGGVINAGYHIEPAATLTSLEVLGEADIHGEMVRGQVVVGPVPASVAINGTYGAKTRVAVRNSAPIDTLMARVTVVPRKGRPGTAVVRFTDVPATFSMDAAASSAGLQVPSLAYKSDAGTLDGMFAVEGSLAAVAYKPPKGGRPLDSSLLFTDLAPDTTVRLNPDLSVDLASKPVATRLIEVHAGLSLAPVKRQRVLFRTDIPYTTGFFGFQMDGHFGMRASEIEDFSLGIHDMSSLKIRPGRIPFGIAAPPALGYVSPGFEGSYDHLDIRAAGVTLNPDVKLNVRIDRKIGKDAFHDTLRLGPARSLEFRRYDRRLRPISGKQPVSLGGAELACLTIGTQPGLAAAQGANAITLRGADGPQMVSLLDPGGQVPGYAVDLLSHFMSPFDGSDLKVSGFAPGRC